MLYGVLKMQKGFWGTLFMIAALSALPIALLSSFMASLSSGVDFRQILDVYIWFGLFFGLLLGVIIAFFMKAYRVMVRYQDREAFLAQLNIAVRELGYHPSVQTDAWLTFTPPIPTGLLSGEISVMIDQGSATITGPATYVKKLQKLLR
jgi:hypothetical protein